MNGDEVVHAVEVLKACDHFDESRRAARALPDDLPVVDVLRAADGATQLARALDVTRKDERMNLLCRVGLHHPRWQPAVRTSRESWLQVRTCTRCGRPLPRTASAR